MADWEENAVMTVIVLCVAVVGWMMWRAKQKEPPGPHGQKPYGVRGVLAFFIVMYYYISPLYILGNTNKALDDVEKAFSATGTLPGWDTYVMFAWGMAWLIIVWNLWIAHRLKNHFRPSSARLAKVSLLALPLLYGLADEVAVNKLFNASGGEVLLLATAKSFGIALFWFLYLQLSRRVKNTYYYKPALTQAKSFAEPVMVNTLAGTASGDVPERGNAAGGLRHEPSFTQKRAAPAPQRLADLEPEPTPAPSQADQPVRLHIRPERTDEKDALPRQAAPAAEKAATVGPSAKELAWQRLEKSILNATPPRLDAAPSSPGHSMQSLEERLATARRLLEMGYITAEDYDRKKGEILGGL